MAELSGLSELARITDPVAQKFADAGHRIYLVGGIVRDLFLAASTDTAGSGTVDGSGTAPVSKASDIDLTTDAHPPAIKSLVGPVADALWAQGERFGTIGATIAGRDFEITTHRAETYDPDSRKPVVSFGSDLGEDLSRRDFTINAMAIELPSREVHDPYGGVADLEARLLRTPLSPEISFTDDPLRIMRAARFVARFDLTPAPDLVKAATELSDRLSIVSVERIADELERLLAVAEPRAGLQFLADTSAFPFEAEAEQLKLAIALASSNDEPAVRRAGLLWPLDTDDEAKAVLKRLRYSGADTTRTMRLIDAARVVVEAPALTAETVEGQTGYPAKTVRTIAAAVGVEDLPLVTALVSNIAANDSRFDEGRAVAFAAAVDELAKREDLSDLGSPLTGQTVIALLGLEPGPAVGRAQKFLSAKRLERGPISESEAKELLQAWWQEQ